MSTGIIVSVVSYSAGATALNLLGNLGIRAISKGASPFAGAIVAGVASGIANTVIINVAQGYFFKAQNRVEKVALSHAFVTLLVGAGAPFTLSLL